MEKGFLFENGKCTSNVGFRQVIVSPEGIIRPVLMATRSGFIPDRKTTQVGYPGDYIFWENYTRSGSKDGVKIVVSEEKAVEIPLTETPKAWELVPGELKSWLEECGNGRQSSMLPAGCGWDGIDTVFDKKKKFEFQRVFSGCSKVYLDILWESVKISPKSGLEFDWKKAGKMPEVMDCPAKFWTGEMVSIDTYTEWVLFYPGGHIEVLRPQATSGEWGSNYAHSDSGQFDSVPEKISKIVKRAIKVTRGAYVRQHTTYGCTWELFKK